MRVTPAEVQQAYRRAGLEVTAQVTEDIRGGQHYGYDIGVRVAPNPFNSVFLIVHEREAAFYPPAGDEKGLEGKLLTGTENLASDLALREITVADVHNEQCDMFPLRNAQRATLQHQGYLFRPRNPENVAQRAFAYCNDKPCIPGEWIKSLDATGRSASFRNLPEPYVNPKSPGKLSVALSRLVHRQ